MKFLAKKIVPRKKSDNPSAPRNSVDLSLIKSNQNGAIRDVFNISDAKFAAFDLDNHSVVFTDGPTAMIILKEGSKLATSFAPKREGSNTKARSFSSPELLEVLETAETIPTERAEFFKASFTLTADETLLAETKEAASQHPEGDFSEDVVGVVLITDAQIGVFTPRKKAEVEGETEGAEGDTSAESGDESGETVSKKGKKTATVNEETI